MKPGLRGRADLLRALMASDPSLATTVADLLEYEKTSAPELPPPQRTLERVDRGVGDPTPLPDTPYTPSAVPFWRLERFEALAFADTAPDPLFPPDSTRKASDPVWRYRPVSPPPFTPLAPKRLVLTRLRQRAARRRSTAEVDIAAVVEQLSRQGYLDHIPRRQQRAWGATLCVVEDRARRLVPYWQDQDVLVDALHELYPPSGLTVARLEDGATQPRIRQPGEQYGQAIMPLPGTMLLVLGDLGCLANAAASWQRFWRQWGDAWREQGVLTVALVPALAQDIPQDLARTWTIIRWDTALPAPPPPSTPAPQSPLQRLLTLLAPAVRLEPGFLRAVRGLIPEGRHDPGLEARVWQDPAILSPHSLAATFDPAHRRELLACFAREDAALPQEVLRLLRTWRGGVPPAVWFEEISGVEPQARQTFAADLEDARAYFARMADTLENTARQMGNLPVAAAAWDQRLSGRFPMDACRDPQLRKAIHRLYDLVRSRDPVAQVQAWFDPAAVALPGQESRQCMLYQAGEQLLLQTTPLPAAVRGSLLGSVQTSSEALTLAPRTDDVREAFWQNGQSPAWAWDWGWDDSGAWAMVRLGTVEQRLRWIPPGRFWMGSPDNEEGRYNREGPQHEVELTQGFWLFDTPCTQALWQEVMESNPSRFKGGRRPVEQVSWEDAQEFCRRLNARLPGLELRLPTEAQWEYACRAGTTTARYEADLDAIAWYAENSNRETHEVGQKRPNAWGLYDMLGNVDEWCYDGRRDYTAAAAVDPVGSTEAGASRAIRGGSWVGVARYVRAAFRLALHPGVRTDDLGFRCSSSGNNQPVARAAWRAALRWAEPAETAPQQPAARLVHLTGQSSMALAMPQEAGFVVRSDRERLSFGQMTMPLWAEEIGRDAYGLWVLFAAGGVQQRLRWIPPGRFWMGSPGSERGRYDNEGPQHEVILTQGFWLFDTPCTQALWQEVMGSNPSRFQGANRPVEQVSWDAVQEFLAALTTRLPGSHWRLPTEAQWEYACRAGTTTARYEANPRAIAWYDTNSNRETHEVGQKRPNAWGLYDMLGNVYEWCYDGRRDYTAAAAVDPVGTIEAGANRARRGGSWDDVAQSVRAAHRSAILPGGRSVNLGFRCSSSG